MRRLSLASGLNFWDHYTPHPLLGAKRENDQIDELFWIAERMIPGQTITFRFKSTDGKHHEYVELTPFPLIFQSDNSRVQVKARLLCASPTMYDLELSGIDNDETFVFSSVSGNETLRDVVKGAGPAILRLIKGAGPSQ